MSVAAPPKAPSPLRGITPRGVLVKLVTEYSFVLSFLLLVIIAGIVNHNFFSWANVSNIFIQSCTIGLIALGMSMVISAGQIDISVGSQVAFIGGFGVLVLNQTGSVLAMLLFCAVAGMIIGLVNGLLITKGRMPSIIATLATMAGLRSIINHFGSGGPFTVDRAFYEQFRQIAAGGVNLFGFNVPYFMIIFIVATIIFDVVMKRTRLGKHIYAVGSNEVSARLSGVNVDRVKTATFVITGLMCGIAALLYASRTTAVAASNAAVGFELDAIAAVAIGGTAMTGGRGKIFGTFLGVLMFSIIRNILTAADVSTFLTGAISAAIIIIAVLLQNFQNRRR
jgi:ribose transport system permease protein